MEIINFPSVIHEGQLNKNNLIIIIKECIQKQCSKTMLQSDSQRQQLNE